jgi:hypothetical protein
MNRLTSRNTFLALDIAALATLAETPKENQPCLSIGDTVA